MVYISYPRVGGITSHLAQEVLQINFNPKVLQLLNMGGFKLKVF